MPREWNRGCEFRDGACGKDTPERLLLRGTDPNPSNQGGTAEQAFVPGGRRLFVCKNRRVIMAISRPKGTNDILPSEMRAWHHMEHTIRSLCAIYGYEEIRTPLFEHTELFMRGVGETSDIVEKEMYTFEDKG